MADKIGRSGIDFSLGVGANADMVDANAVVIILRAVGASDEPETLSILAGGAEHRLVVVIVSQPMARSKSL